MFVCVITEFSFRRPLACTYNNSS